MSARPGSEAAPAAARGCGHSTPASCRPKAGKPSRRFFLRIDSCFPQSSLDLLGGNNRRATFLVMVAITDDPRSIAENRPARKDHVLAEAGWTVVGSRGQKQLGHDPANRER